MTLSHCSGHWRRCLAVSDPLVTASQGCLAFSWTLCIWLQPFEPKSWASFQSNLTVHLSSPDFSVSSKDVMGNSVKSLAKVKENNISLFGFFFFLQQGSHWSDRMSLVNLCWLLPVTFLSLICLGMASRIAWSPSMGLRWVLPACNPPAWPSWWITFAFFQALRTSHNTNNLSKTIKSGFGMSSSLRSTWCHGSVYIQCV